MIGRRALLAGLLASASGVSAQRFRVGRAPGFQAGLKFLAAAGNGPPFTTVPYSFVGKDTFLSSDAYSNIYENAFDSSRAPTDGYFDLAMDVWFNGSGNDGPMFSRWANSNNGAANSSFLFGVASGTLRCAAFTSSSSSFIDPRSSVKLNTVIPDRTRAMIRLVLNNSANTINGYAAGTATYYTSVDKGATWQQLGTTVTGLDKNGLVAGGSTLAVLGTLNSSNVTFGRVYSVTMKNSAGTNLYAVDLRSMAIGQAGTFTTSGISTVTWNINGPLTTDMTPTAAQYPRLKAGASYKIKSLEVSPTTDGDWGTLWANYSSTDFASRIQWAKSQGANCVKWTCSGARTSYSKYPAAATLEANIADVCATLRANGMKLYLSMAHSDEINTPDGTGRVSRVADLVATAKLWMKYGTDVIVGADLCNEVQFGFAPSSAGLSNGGKPTGWGSSSGTVAPMAGFAADMAYWYSQARTVMPDVPMSFSCYMNARTDLGSLGFLMSQATYGMQFHDYHPYNSTNGQTASAPTLATGSSSPVPAASDLSPLEAQPWFLGAHTIGECGIQRRYGTSDKQNWFNGLIAQATSAKSLGWVGGFIDYDFNSGNEPGDYGIRSDATLTSAFASMTGGTVA